MRGKTVCIANQKGGVGKTTTAINLATSLALLKKKILIADIDPQGNAGSGMGIEKDGDKNIYHALVLESSLDSIIKKTEVPGLSFLSSNMDLTGAEIELVNLPQREFRLRKSLEQVKDQFDYIFIDCPPSLGLLTINSLVAADSVLVPLQCEYYALEGLSQLLKTIKLIKTQLNPDLTLEGILLTMFDKRNRLSHQVAGDITKHFETRVFEIIIPRNVRLAESPSYGLPVYFYDKQSVGAKAYVELAQQFLIKQGENG